MSNKNTLTKVNVTKEFIEDFENCQENAMLRHVHGVRPKCTSTTTEALNYLLYNDFNESDIVYKQSGDLLKTVYKYLVENKYGITKKDRFNNMSIPFPGEFKIPGYEFSFTRFAPFKSSPFYIYRFYYMERRKFDGMRDDIRDRMMIEDDLRVLAHFLGLHTITVLAVCVNHARNLDVMKVELSYNRKQRLNAALAFRKKVAFAHKSGIYQKNYKDCFICHYFNLCNKKGDRGTYYADHSKHLFIEVPKPSEECKKKTLDTMKKQCEEIQESKKIEDCMSEIDEDLDKKAAELASQVNSESEEKKEINEIFEKHEKRAIEKDPELRQKKNNELCSLEDFSGDQMADFLMIYNECTYDNSLEMFKKPGFVNKFNQLVEYLEVQNFNFSPEHDKFIEEARAYFKENDLSPLKTGLTDKLPENHVHGVNEVKAIVKRAIGYFWESLGNLNLSEFEEYPTERIHFDLHQVNFNKPTVQFLELKGKQFNVSPYSLTLRLVTVFFEKGLKVFKKGKK